MSRLHFDELLAWAASVKPNIEGVEGPVFADIARTGPGERDYARSVSEGTRR